MLTEYVDAARTRPFSWGSNDCVTFSSGWVGLMTGADPSAQFHGQYQSERKAFEIMVRHGVKSMEAAGWFLFGVPDERPVFVSRGDVVYARGALGICLGSNGAFLTEDGLEFIPRDEFAMFWKV